jgi:hypothetical protein
VSRSKHFVGAHKMIDIGNQAERKVEDWYLSRLEKYQPKYLLNGIHSISNLPINKRTVVGSKLPTSLLILSQDM